MQEAAHTQPKKNGCKHKEKKCEREKNKFQLLFVWVCVCTAFVCEINHLYFEPAVFAFTFRSAIRTKIRCVYRSTGSDPLNGNEIFFSPDDWLHAIYLFNILNQMRTEVIRIRDMIRLIVVRTVYVSAYQYQHQQSAHHLTWRLNEFSAKKKKQQARTHTQTQAITNDI